MNIINIKALQTLITEAALMGPPQNIIQTFNQNYILRSQIKLHEYDTLDHIGERINLRYKNKNKNTPGVFGNGELKLFTWVLMLYCQYKQKLLNSFNEQDLINIQHIFKKEELSRIDYEIRCFSTTKNRQDVPWSQQEIRLFTQITKQYNATEWKTIAFLMFKLSNREFFRPFEHYRQKWINYLNPNLEKGKWTLKESVKMMEIVSREGRKWAHVSRELNNSRSQHSIKNHFKKLLREFCKKQKNKQQGIKDIDQKILNYLRKQLKKNLTKESAQQQSQIQNKKEQELSQKVQSEKIEGQKQKQRQLGMPKLEEGQLNCLKEEDAEKYNYIFYGREKQMATDFWARIYDREQYYYPFLLPYCHP